MAKTLFGDEIQGSPKTVFGDPVKPSGGEFEGLMPIGEEDDVQESLFKDSPSPLGILLGEETSLPSLKSIADPTEVSFFEGEVPSQMVGAEFASRKIVSQLRALGLPMDKLIALQPGGQEALDQLKEKRFFEKVPEAFGYVEETAVELFALHGLLRGAGFLQKLPKSATVLDKALETGKFFGAIGLVDEAKTVLRGEEPRGGLGIVVNFALGMVFSLGLQGGVSVWKALKPTEQSIARKILGLRKGASVTEVAKAAQNALRDIGVDRGAAAHLKGVPKFNPAQIQKKVELFKRVTEARDVLFKEIELGTEGVVFPKIKPKLLTGNVPEKSLLDNVNAAITKKSKTGVTERVKSKAADFFAQKKQKEAKPVVDASTKKTIKEKDKIVVPSKAKLTTASRLISTGEVFAKEGVLHHETQMMAEAKKLNVPVEQIEQRVAAGELELLNDLDVEHGFIDETGKFVLRPEAAEIAGVAHIPGKFDALDIGRTPQEVLTRRLEVQKDIVDKGKKAVEAFDKLTEKEQDEIVVSKISKFETLETQKPPLVAKTGQLVADIAPKPDIGIETPTVEKPATTSELMDQLAEVDKHVVEIEAVETLLKKERDKALKRGHALASDMHMDDETFQEFKKTSVGKTSMSDMTSDEMKLLNADLAQYKKYLNDPVEKLNDTIKRLGLTDTELARLKKASRNKDDVLGTVLKKVEAEGGLVTPSQERNLQMRLIRDHATTIANWKVKGIKKGRPINVFNPLVSSRYSLYNAEWRTGIPISKLSIDIASLASQGKQTSMKEFLTEMKEAGRTGLAPGKTVVQDELIGDFLFNSSQKGRDEAFEKMNPLNKRMANSLAKMMSQTSNTGNALRRMRWIRLDHITKEIERVEAKVVRTDADKKKLERMKQARDKVAIPDAPKNVIEIGRGHKDLGTFDEWINSQTWGTREFYYMTESNLNAQMNEMFEPLIPGDLRITSPIGKQTPVYTPSETLARKGKGKRLTRPVLQAVLMHMNRVQSAAAIQESMYELQKKMRNVEMSQDDLKNLQRYFDNLTGIPQHVGKPTEIAEFANRTFWRFFPLQLARIGHFVGRNLLQNMANAPSQASYKEFLLASNAIYKTKNVNPWLAEHFEQSWSEVSEKMLLQNEFMLLDSSGLAADPFFKKFPELQFRATMSMDWLGKSIPWSDEQNRRLIFPVFHQMAYRNVQRYQRTGNYAAFLRNLEVQTLRPVQVDELNRYIAEKNFKEFTRKYAIYKTENVHYKYRTSGRSLSEQFRTDKALMGLIVFPRGTAEIAYYNGISPLFKGLKTGDVNQAYQGMKSLAKLVLGWRTASLAALILMGKRFKDDYELLGGLLGYAPGSVGFQKIVAAFEDNMNQWSLIVEQKGFSEEAADQIAARAVKTIEFALPMVDVLVNAAEVSGDTAGLNFYRLIRSKINERYLFEKGVRLKHYDRDMLAKIQHILFGAEEVESRELRLTTESIEAFQSLSTKEQALYLTTGHWPQ